MNKLLTERRGRAKHAPLGTLPARMRRAMTAAGLDGVQVSLSLSDDSELQALNLEYADEDHPTDVLSFAQAEGPMVPHGDLEPLGDIVISVEYARRQAKEGLRAELFHLAVHGLVHLLGFDHRDSAEERVMFGYETRIREAALAPGPVKAARRPPGAKVANRLRR